MNWAAIRHVAHRCGGRLAPENTLEGLRLAAAAGFCAVEFDVMLSGDGTPILIHDETLDRTTDGHGEVARTTDASLARLRANRGFEREFPAARIPRLDSAISVCRELGLAMNVEIKPAAGCDVATATAVAACLRRAAGGKPWGDMPPPLLSSFSLPALRVARALLPELPAALLVGEVPDDWQERLAELGCTSLHAAAGQRDWAWLGAARAAAVAVRCYTVNDAAECEALFERGVAAVFTDALELFAEVRGGNTNGNNC